MDIASFLYPATGTIISILLFSNIFFIKRLVDKIEDSSIKLSKAEDFLIDVKKDIENLRNLQVDVKVIKTLMNIQRDKND